MNFSGHNTTGHRKTVQVVTPEAMSAYLDEVEDSLGVNARRADREAEEASEAAFTAMEAKVGAITAGNVIILNEVTEPITFVEIAQVIDLQTPELNPVLVEAYQETPHVPSVVVSA